MTDAGPRPLVSVIVAARDEARFIGEALDSVAAQTYPAVEVIVADDGSTDDTAGIAAEQGARVLPGPFGGPAAARNAALAVARGEYWLPLDADDLLPPDRVRVQVSALESEPELGFVVGLTEMFVTPGEPAPSHFRPEWRELQRGVPGAMLARSSLVDSVGTYDPARMKGEDVDWFVRTQEAGVRWRQLNVLCLRYRIHADNSSQDIHANRRALLSVIRSSVQRRRASTHDG